MGKPTFCICENKGAYQLLSNCEADQCLCFVTWIVEFHFFLNLKFPVSSDLLVNDFCAFVINAHSKL